MEPLRVDAPLIGKTISHYEILEPLGEGGMGVVYRARDTRLDRTVALKLVRPDAAASRERRERFVREARAASALNHSHIVTIHDIDRATCEGTERDFIVMEHVDGTSLDRLVETGPLPLAQVLDFATQIASALAAAHAAGIVHRDVKPANVMVTRKGEVKLLDFGLAKLAEAPSGDDAEPTATQGARTEAGAVLGTPSYMSPEQAEGRPVDCRTDIFSFGSLLYELLTGRRPFRGDSHVATRKAVLTSTPPLPRTERPELPRDVERIVLRCLEKEREARYPSGSELLHDLEQARRHVTAPLRAWRRPRVAIPAALALVAVVSWGAWFYRRSAQARWARSVAVPEIARLDLEGQTVQAYRLAEQALPYLAGDDEATRLWDAVTAEAKAHTTPEGAEVSWQAFGEPESVWHRVGRSPIDKFRVPRGLLRWRAEKAGFDPAEVARQGQWGLQLDLQPAGSTPKGMVRVRGGPVVIGSKSFQREAFWLDKFEVTNREFQAFVDASGYRRPEYWKEPFLLDGRTLSFEEGLAKLVDRSGRPGPATWEGGSFPAGEEDYPVRGVSFYEAAAFAAFAGKSLPTVHHWRAAADQISTAPLITASNFAGKGPARAGEYRGLGPYGTYDMAGNVREWCQNVSGAKRYMIGGGWDDPVYAYTMPQAQPPFERPANQGFRCMKLEGPPAPELLAPIERTWRDYTREKPADDAAFRVMKGLYAFDRTPLDPVLEPLTSRSPHWKKEKITMAAAYGGERLIAYLFLPTNAPPPYQTVVYFPGSGAALLPRLREPDADGYDFILRSGRAVLYPVYKGTYERRLREDPPWPTRAYRDLTIETVQDLVRAVDYLETREDIDRDRLAYDGVSWGATMGPIILVVDPRFKAAVLVSGGLDADDDGGMPEIDMLHFTPRVMTPTLMVNGRDDFRFPLEESQKPMFRLLGCKPGDKDHVLVEGGHGFPRILLVKPTLDWLDRYLGPVAARKGAGP